MTQLPDGLTAFRLWGDRGWYPNQNVVGESHYTDHIRSLLPDRIDTSGHERLAVPALLWPDPGNAYDTNAIAVVIDGGTVGHLPKEVAADYALVLAGMVARGRMPETTARVYGFYETDWDTDRQRFVGSVQVSLPAKHLLEPVNQPPADSFVELPFGSAIQVTGEEMHVDQLSRYARPEGEAWAWVTLHQVEEQTARTSKTLVEVRIDGQPAGRLSPKLSGDLLPAVQLVERAGRTTAARALVKGNRLKMEVVVYAARAHELTDEWIAALGPVPEAVETPPWASAPPPAAPAGWYPDPAGEGQRWWDGSNWTESVSGGLASSGS